jgi:membrane protease YdiL (CAAX protease family)
MLALGHRLPILVRAPVAGFVIAAAGTYPWATLASWNQRVLVRVPWALLPMSVYLWFYWRYLGGAGWPRSTSSLRRKSLRANTLEPELWVTAILTGLLGLATLVPLLGIMSRLAALPAESRPINVPAEMSFVTVFFLLVMASLVAGVVEEAAFRGYMQGPIERRHGVPIAILVNGALFGLAHYTHHPESVLMMLPYYIGVAAVYGGLAYATDSILPGVALHAGGDVLSLMRLWATGLPEWQVAAEPPPLIWQTGVDAAFVGGMIVFLALSSAAVWAYASLARAARAARSSAAPV